MISWIKSIISMTNHHASSSKTIIWIIHVWGNDFPKLIGVQKVSLETYYTY